MLVQEISVRFKVGDPVLFTSLITPGDVGVAEVGFREGVIRKIEMAGENGARAMDCSPSTMLYLIGYGDAMTYKFEEELMLDKEIPEKTRQTLLSRRRKL